MNIIFLRIVPDESCRNMLKVVIEISQGSVVTQTVLGGLTINLPVANFICFISAKNYENWLKVDKVIAMNTVCSFLAHPVHMTVSCQTYRSQNVNFTRLLKLPLTPYNMHDATKCKALIISATIQKL